MATHSSILAWKMPKTEEPVGLQYLGSQRIRHDLATEHTCTGTGTKHGLYFYFTNVCVCVLSRVRLSSTLNCSLTGSSVHGIFQARILEWVLFPTLGDLPDPVIEPVSLALTGGFFTTAPPRMHFTILALLLVLDLQWSLG